MNLDSAMTCPAGFDDLHEQLEALVEVTVPDWLDEVHSAGELVVVHSWIRAFQAILCRMESNIIWELDNKVLGS